MTERMVPVELLERILSITQPIAPSISSEVSNIIGGPGVEPDGVKARCGGPLMCRECAQDLAVPHYSTDNEK